MNLWVIIPFVSFFASAMLVVYIFAYNRTQPVNRAYMILSLAITAWIFGDFLLWIPVAESLVMTVLKIESIAWLTLGFWFMRFTYIFIQRKKDKMYWLIMFICFGSVPVALFTDLIMFSYKLEYWGYRIVGGLLYNYVTELAVTFPFLYTLMLLVNKYRRSTDNEFRSQLLLIILQGKSILNHWTNQFRP